MLITSKYTSVCKMCQKAVLVGDRVSWVRTEKGVSHAACSSEGRQIRAEQALSRATEATIDIPVPEGRSYLGYQLAGIAYALGRKGTLIADEMGLGKTVQAFGV